jgi:hypothetical protein
MQTNQFCEYIQMNVEKENNEHENAVEYLLFHVGMSMGCCVLYKQAPPKRKKNNLMVLKLAE